MTYTPRTQPYAHQVEALERCAAKPQRPSSEDVFAYLMEQGTGKSRVLLDEWGQRAKDGDLPNLLIVAPAGCYRNWVEDKNELQKSEINAHLDPELLEQMHVGIWESGSNRALNELRVFMRKTGPRLMMVNVEALSTVPKARAACSYFLQSAPSMMAVDECFIAGTLVATPQGPRAIETIMPGDEVTSWSGVSCVRTVFRKRSTVLSHIQLSNKRSIVTTPNHPFFTTDGWVCAGNLKGHIVYGQETLSNLQDEAQTQANSARIQILWDILFSEVADGTARGKGASVQPGAECKTICDDEGSEVSSCWVEQGDAVAQEYSRQDQGQSSSIRSHVCGSWREWAQTSEAAAYLAEHIGFIVDYGACHSIGKEASRLSNLLQGRSRLSIKEVSDRVRWEQPQLNSRTSPRQKERLKVEGTRVESVTLEKRTNSVEVFDLELEGCPHYFVENVLVHNSTKIKNKSKRTEHVIKIGRDAVARRILSGLPTPKSPIDIFYQFEFLDWRILKQRSWFGFRARYAEVSRICFLPMEERKRREAAGQYIPYTDVIEEYKHLDELQELVAAYSFRKLKNECLDLPEKVYQIREVPLTDEQERVYGELRDQATSQLNSMAHVTATAVITRLIRMHQVLCGHAVDENDNLRSLKNHRVSALMDVIEETSGKIVVWCAYHHDVNSVVKAIAEAYGPEAVAQFHGKNTGIRGAEERRWLGDPTCQVMVATKAGGHGNTWVKAETVVYFSNTDNLEDRMQSEDRSHRAGLKHKVTYVDLMVPGTIEEKIIESMRSKIDLATLVMGDPQRKWLI